MKGPQDFKGGVRPPGLKGGGEGSVGKQAFPLAARSGGAAPPIPETGSPPGAGDPAEPGVLQDPAPTSTQLKPVPVRPTRRGASGCREE